MQAYKSIKWKYLSILFVLFTIVIGGRYFYDSKHHKDMLEDKTSHLVIDIEKIFNSSSDSLTNKYSMLTKHLINDEHVYSAFKYGKRNELHKLLKKDYIDYKQLDPNLYVMHFFDTNNVTVLRMHKPESYNDDLTEKRPMVAYANRSLKQQSAFEVGKNGIVYRVTTPYIYNDKHIGVLEFGISPRHFVDAIKTQYEVESQILVKGELLDVLVAKKSYEKLNGYSIISQSSFFKKISTKIDLKKKNQIIEYDSRYYFVYTNLNLHNYQNEPVGKVVIAKDITEFILENKSSLFFINIITLSIIVFIFFLLYFIFTKYVNEIDRNIQKMNSLEKQSKHLEKRANRDSLTNTFNKDYFNKYLIDFLKINRNGVILFFDIDHFKDCNDTYGHLIGDKILVKLSQEIHNYLRSNDLFVRWGGEEFIILFEDISFDIALRKAQSIRLLVENAEFTNNIPITISIGITKIKDDDTMVSLLNRADSLLYTAKESGRNRVVSDLT